MGASMKCAMCIYWNQYKTVRGKPFKTGPHKDKGECMNLKVLDKILTFGDQLTSPEFITEANWGCADYDHGGNDVHF